MTKNRVLKGIVPSVTILTQLILNVVPTLQKRNNISNLFLKLKFTAKSVRLTKALIDLIKVAQPHSFSSRLVHRIEEYALIKNKREHIAD